MIELRPQLKNLLKQILFLFLVYAACRLLFYFFNRSAFQNISVGELLSLFFYGLRFDAFSICALNIVYILLCSLPFRFYFSKPYQIVLAVFFILPNSIGILLNFVDFAYFPFNNKRTTYNVVNYIFSGQTEFTKLLPQFLTQYWYVVLLFVLFEYAFIKFYFKSIKDLKLNVIPYNFKNWISTFMFFLILNGLSILGIRGGLQRIPIIILDAAAYTSPDNIPIVVNTPFFVLKTIELTAIEPIQIISQSEEHKYFNPIHAASKNEFKNENVCIIILESFSKEYSKIGKRKSYTPFLDSLMLQSIVFANGIANGKSSIEGIPSILASMPSYMNNPYINSMYSNNHIESLASTLKNKNYSTVFFHGGTNGTMNFNIFSQIAGFDNYFGRTEYNNDADYDGQWGIWDEPFLQRTVKEINQLKKPFFTAIFTLSSHNPYKVPQKYKGKFPKGNYEITESIGYADYALKQFFMQAQKQDWFKNTLFVLCPDHTGESDNPFYARELGQYSIPITFYKHGVRPNINLKTVQQIDIMPTVLTYLNYDKSYYALGNNMFDTIVRPCLYYVNPQYYCAKDSMLYTINNYKIVEKFIVNSDSGLNRHLKPELKDLELEKYCQALLQRYNRDLIENKIKAHGRD